MKINEIRELAEIMRANGLTSVKISRDGMNIQLENAVAPVAYAPVQAPAYAPMQPIEQPIEAPVQSTKDVISEIGAHVITSPLVGVFYAAPSPESKPYANVGDTVKVGDVLCIVEAMKMMNEITADCDGEIIEVCEKDGQIVDFGRPLFKIKKS